MKKTCKRVLSLLLAALLLGGAAPLGALTLRASAKTIGEYAQGDHVEFGWYPQTEVKDDSLIAALNASGGAWHSYGYYSGFYGADIDYSVSANDGRMAPSDYMQYRDVMVGAEKYRGVRFSKYRPTATSYIATAASSVYSEQDDNGYFVDTTYWFRFEPVQWRVLDPAAGLVLCETIIDSQAYNNYVVSSVYVYDEYGRIPGWGDVGKTYYANNYEHSSIRAWLNDDFYNTAFSPAQQEIISYTTLDNSAYNAYNGPYPDLDCAQTTDKIYLLSRSDVLNPAYGFDEIEADDFIHSARIGQGTDYAKCQGLEQRWYSWTSSQEFSAWWLRSAFGSGSGAVCGVDHTTCVTFFGVGGACVGVRPALNLDPTSAIVQSDVSETGTRTGSPDKLLYNRITYRSSESHPAFVDVFFDPLWVTKSNKKYNHALAQFCAAYALLGYTSASQSESAEETVRSGLQAMGFTVGNVKHGKHAVDLDTKREQVNFFIAHQEIEVNGSSRTLVFAGLIGSNKYQWYSDFDPNGTERDENVNGGNGYVDPEEDEMFTANLGFADARDFALKKLKEYYKLQGIDPSSAILLLTGHSRGAAAANMLAAKLVNSGKLANADSIYAYTFATPRGVVKPRVGHNGEGYEKYRCIFNIVNPEDFVTKVMLDGWGYSRFGVTYTLPSKTNDYLAYETRYLPAMKQVFSRCTRSDYLPYRAGEAPTYAMALKMRSEVQDVNAFYKKKYLTSLGLLTPFEFFKEAVLGIVSKTDILECAVKARLLLTDLSAQFYKELLSYFLTFNYNGVWASLSFEQAHMMETYYAYMTTLSSSQIKQKRGGFLGSVNCPVDVDVYENESGELVGRIVNNTVDEETAAKENSIVMWVDGDSKQFWLPSDGDFRVELTGNDTGTMDYSVAVIDSDAGETQRVNFFDVPVENGKKMTEIFTPETDEFSLRLEDDSTLTPSESFDPQDADLFSIETSAGQGGSVSGGVTAVSGDYVCVSAAADEYYKFVGWFEGETCVSREADYGFVAKQDRSLTAQFSPYIYDAVLIADGEIVKTVGYARGQESIQLPEVPKKEGYTGTWPSYALPDGGVTITAEYTKNTYTVTWRVEDSTTSDTVLYGEIIRKPDDPQKDGSTFVGWTPEVPETMPAKDMTFVAQFRKNGRVRSVSADSLTLNYKADGKLQPVVTADDGIETTVAYSGFDNRIISVDASGKVTALKKGSTTVTVTATDENGNTAETKCTVTVKYAWWQWLILILLFGWIWYR